MAKVSAFSGIRYDPGLVPDLSDVIAPPYDVISSQLQEELHGRALQNVVRIELGKQYPEDRPGESDRYTRARAQLRVWLEQGFLVQDQTPSLYLYRHSFRPPGGGGPRERLGCFVGVEPVPHERGEVLRHELTLTGPREDRLRLLEATRVQTSAVFLLYENAEEVTQALRQGLDQGQAIGEAVTDGEYGRERHQLWRISAPELVETITRGLSSTRLFIADGHHRYETALNLGLHGVLALVSPLSDPGNVILPTHRILGQSPVALAELGSSLSAAGWRVEPAPGELGTALQALAELRQGSHAFLICAGPQMLLAARQRGDESGVSPRNRLDVSVLEKEILEQRLGISAAEAAAGRLRYSRSAEEVVESTSEEGLGFLLNYTSVEEMASVAEAGEAMPQKSTYFYPKVPAGLIMMRVG